MKGVLLFILNYEWTKRHVLPPKWWSPLLGSLKPGKARRTQPLGILGLIPYYVRRKDDTQGRWIDFCRDDRRLEGVCKTLMVSESNKYNEYKIAKQIFASTRLMAKTGSPGTSHVPVMSRMWGTDCGGARAPFSPIPRHSKPLHLPIPIVRNSPSPLS